MDRELLETLLAEGLSLDKIADRVARSPSTVSYWLKRHGLAANGATKYGPGPPVDPRELRALVERGHTVPSLAKRLGRSPAVIRRALAQHGLVTRQARNRRVAAAALAQGLREVELDCARHGLEPHVLEGRGSFRCMRCRGEQVSRHRRRVKRTLIAEAGGKCVICGYSRCDAALQFHHLDPATKAFHLSLRGVTRSWAEVRTEAAKCVLLCATCHAEVEVGYIIIDSELQ